MNRTVIMVGAGVVAGLAALAVWLLGGDVADTPGGATPTVAHGTGAEGAPPAPLPTLGPSNRPERRRRVAAAPAPAPAPRDIPRAPRRAAPAGEAGDEGVTPVTGDAGVPEGWAEGDALPPSAMVRFVPDRDGIRAAISERKALIEECYDGWARSPDAPEGKIVARFTIAPGVEGGAAKIKDAGLTASGLDHLAVEGCVLNALQGLGFESPGREITVNYPFEFKRKQRPAQVYKDPDSPPPLAGGAQPAEPPEPPPGDQPPPPDEPLPPTPPDTAPPPAPVVPVEPP